ncbi:MAG: hypothetical protein R2794_12090 [Chitinophagales bacterium]
MKYMNWKDQKEMTSDLKKIYQANNADIGLHLLEQAEQKWGKNTRRFSKVGEQTGTG